ncbi:Mismatch repair protein msh3, partial [Clydaea vesicula]
ILLDEVGRGTSTEEAISLSFAILEHIVNEMKCRTLFATHYKQLLKIINEKKKLEPNSLNGIEFFKTEVKICEGEAIYSYKFVKGVANDSHGIFVAERAGIDKKITNRAKFILSEIKDRKCLSF